jgi:hypothetical protein
VSTCEELWVPAPAKLLTQNEARRLHYYRLAEITRQWRMAARIMALDSNLPRFAQADITYTPVKVRGPLADPGAHAPTAKMVVDGLVDARVLPGDTGAYVLGLKGAPPEKGPADGLRIRLVGTLELAAGLDRPGPHGH